MYNKLLSLNNQKYISFRIKNTANRYNAKQQPTFFEN